MSNPYERFICINHLISDPGHTSYDFCPMGENDFERIQSMPIFERIARCVYWYAVGSWEGTGDAIIQATTGEWYLVDLNHCSCYGPDEGFLGLDSTCFFSSREALAEKQAGESSNVLTLIKYIQDNPLKTTL